MTSLLQFSAQHITLVGSLLLTGTLLIILETLRHYFISKPLSPTLAALFIKRQQAILLDLRDSVHFLAGHLPNAQSVNFETLKETLSQIKADSPIIFITENNEPSLKVLQLCRKAGFNQLHHLEGGVEAWKNANLPLSIQSGK